MFQIDRISLTSTDSYRCDSSCLAQVFQNLPAPPKHYIIFDVFLFCKVFFQPENLGSHLAMSPDDRFLPQGKQIFPKISKCDLCLICKNPNISMAVSEKGGKPDATCKDGICPINRWYLKTCCGLLWSCNFFWLHELSFCSHNVHTFRVSDIVAIGQVDGRVVE